MTEATKPTRRNLALPLAGVRSRPEEAPASPSSAVDTAERHGFDRVPVAASEIERLRQNQTAEPPRRKRGAGRSMPFSVKLAPGTMEYIYEVANSRDIPLAQVIEELVEAHRAAAR